ncbi:MAG TPA: PEP-CTERM sorting domain-containing protein [Terriglobales bacterium]|nr:PEP-CTERM sorting domain-containing protein [Terriglobales bacterium]
MKRCLAVLVLLTSVSLGAAFAGTINIGNGATGSNPTGLNQPLSPVLVGNGSDISVYLQGSAAITNTFLLALIVPNVTAGTGVNSPASLTLYGSFPGGSTPCPACAIGSLTFQGTLSSTSGTKLSGLGGALANFSDSLNATNFDTFDHSAGVTPMSFGVYTWTITTGELSGSNHPLIDFSIPEGELNGSIFAALTDNGNSTVWTNSGGVETPEPATAALLAIGLLLAGFVARKRQPA